MSNSGLGLGDLADSLAQGDDMYRSKLAGSFASQHPITGVEVDQDLGIILFRRYAADNLVTGTSAEFSQRHAEQCLRWLRRYYPLRESKLSATQLGMTSGEFGDALEAAILRSKEIGAELERARAERLEHSDLGRRERLETDDERAKRWRNEAAELLEQEAEIRRIAARNTEERTDV